MKEKKTVGIYSCPICLSPQSIALVEDWEREVAEEDKVIPLIGCGNTWHYLVGSRAEEPSVNK